MAALPDAVLVHQPPAIFWSSAATARMDGGKISVQQLVIASNTAACQLLRHCCMTQQAAGVIMLPEQARGPGIALPGSADKVCFIYLLDDSGSAIQSNASQPNESSSLAESTGQLNLNAAAPTSKQTCSLLVFCQMPMQPERATSWIQGLLHVVQAQHVLVIASLPAFNYRGPGDPSQDALHYVVCSSAAKQQSQSCGVPSLPSGSLITGLAAAAVQYSEARRLSATALVGIEARPVPDVASLRQLAVNMEKLLKANGSSFIQANSLMKAARQAEKVLSAAASNSFMYV